MNQKFSQIANDADSLIETLLGVSPSGPSEPVEEPVFNGSNESYQLPVQVGRENKPLSSGDKPWIVGHFSPGVQTDPNHPKGHNGVDLKAPMGSPIYPVASGVVVASGSSPISGNFVKVSHEGGRVISYYGHMQKTNAAVNQKVDQRTIIGYVGDSGNAKGRGAHLHYEVKVNGGLINPFSIVGKTVGSLAKKAKIFSDIEKYSLYCEALLSVESISEQDDQIKQKGKRDL
jgi:murein DD-endopeptidase MepM/ murein hydrolase activator NlpD